MANKRNNIEHHINIQECVDFILDNRSGWSQFTQWYMEKYNTNRQQANRLWSKAWEIIVDDFEDNIKQSVNETILELETLKEEARAEGDRRIWLETIKYQAKIKGAEVERHQVDVKGNINVTLNWGDDEIDNA